MLKTGCNKVCFSSQRGEKKRKDEPCKKLKGAGLISSRNQPRRVKLVQWGGARKLIVDYQRDRETLALVRAKKVSVGLSFDDKEQIFSMCQ